MEVAPPALPSVRMRCSRPPPDPSTTFEALPPVPSVRLDCRISLARLFSILSRQDSEKRSKVTPVLTESVTEVSIRESVNALEPRRTDVLRANGRRGIVDPHLRPAAEAHSDALFASSRDTLSALLN